MPTKPKAKSKVKSDKRPSTRCWKGYEPTPGKKPFSKGSCKPKAK